MQAFDSIKGLNVGNSQWGVGTTSNLTTHQSTINGTLASLEPTEVHVGAV